MIHRIHLAAPSYRVFTPVAFVAGCALLFVTRQQWAGWPSGSAYFALIGFMLAAPLLAGVAAYEADRMTSANAANWVPLTVSLKARLSGQRLAAGWASVVLLALGWGAVVAVVFLAAHHVVSPLPMEPILGYLALAALAVPLGHTLGCCHGPLALRAGAAAAGILLIAVLTTMYGWTEPDVRLKPLPLAVTAAAAVVMTIVAVFSPAERYPTAVGMVSFLLACALVAGTAPFTDSGTTGRVARDPVCAPGRPTLCVWREHEPSLSELANVRDRAASYLPRGFSVPERLNDCGLDGGDDATFALTLTRDSYASPEDIREAYLNALFNWAFLHDGESKDAQLEARDLLQGWVTIQLAEGRMSPESVTYTDAEAQELARVLALPEAEQRAWMQRTFEEAGVR